MKNRIRRASRAMISIHPRRRAANIPGARLATVRETLAHLFHGDLTTANDSDNKHFEPVDVVTLAIPRGDLVTISAALLHIAKPDTMELVQRLPHMRVRVGQTPLTRKGAIQDRQ